jgi:hypothetical protein
MEQYLTWTKGLLESSYQLFSNGKIKGSLFFDIWKNEARGIGTERNYIFATTGLASSTTHITDENGTILGIITYNVWKTTATVTLKNDEIYIWNFTNNWHSKWCISNFKNQQISYDSSSSGGTIITDTTDEMILLAGLVIKEYYTRIFVIIILLIFIPIVTNVF